MMQTLKVIKIGGNIINDEVALSSFLEGFAQLESPKILIHGGGKLATKLAQEMNVEVKMKEGRRITDAKTLDIITMVYAGKVNKTIVAKLQANKCNAVGFSGADGNSIVSKRRPIQDVNYGFVGDVKKINTEIIQVLLDTRITPVFSAITHDENGQLLNTNADTIASELAIAFANDYNTELYYCFEKKGVLEDIKNEDSVIEHINTKSYQILLKTGIISDGMLPKLNNCFYAINHQVHKVCIGKPIMLFNENITHTTIQK